MNNPLRPEQPLRPSPGGSAGPPQPRSGRAGGGCPQGRRGGGSARRLWNPLPIPPPAAAPAGASWGQRARPRPRRKSSGTRGGPARSGGLRDALPAPRGSTLRAGPRASSESRVGIGARAASAPATPTLLRPGRSGRGARSSGRAAQSRRARLPARCLPPGPGALAAYPREPGRGNFSRRAPGRLRRPSAERRARLRGAWARRGPRARQQRHRAEAGRRGGAASAGPATRAGLGLGSGSGAGGGSGRAAAARLVYSGRCQRLRRPGLLLLRRRAPPPRGATSALPAAAAAPPARPAAPPMPPGPGPGPAFQAGAPGPRGLPGRLPPPAPARGRGRKWGRRSQSPRSRSAGPPDPTASAPAPRARLLAPRAPRAGGRGDLNSASRARVGKDSRSHSEPSLGRILGELGFIPTPSHFPTPKPRVWARPG